MLTGSFYVKSCFSPDGRWILSGSKDFAAYVWEVDQPGRAPLRLSGHDGEVTAVAWNPLDLDQVRPATSPKPPTTCAFINDVC